MDMKFVGSADEPKKFCTYWQAVATNRCKYFTKHHPAIHNHTMQFIYLTTPHPPGMPTLLLASPTQSSHCKDVLHMPVLCKVNSSISSGTHGNRS
eukprot:CCRYP_008361-RA/>CCRYP_008361-RA protein AED:0.58 eAED:0.58 QI:0/-1/0/1/-1/0/1/0/94